ncbi:hypothetical protein ACFWFF_10460 [Streptomyces sp. NPDC060223]|uniref:hypothetical protein n=1 Tax=unclassified Streptomyces TaxID=2593676 RepID=UPI003629EBA5
MAHRDDNSVHADNNRGNLVAHAKNVRVYGSPGQSPDTLELQRRIEELQRLLTQHAAALPDAERLRQVTQELGNQLQDPQPNRTVVRSLLDSLTAGAGGVTAVLTAVTGLTQFASRFV